MLRNFFEELRGFKDSTPNKFTIHLGKLIRKARLEANMTQAELAKEAYFSQTAISQIEQGKRDVTVAEIIYLSIALDKPILYFYQPYEIRDNSIIELSPLENELINQAKKLSTDDLRKLVAQTKALVKLNTPESK
jgi:transcriptional regulator with XRE-family HTH domain